MSETIVKGDEEEQKKAAAEAVASYLQSPRKKRKTYIVLAFGKNFDYDLATSILNFCKSKYSYMGISVCRTKEEFSRNFSRKIGLCLVNDEFTDRQEMMDLIGDLKVRKKVEGVPVLFFTRDPEKLLKDYHEKLLPYHEIDEFVPYLSLNESQILSRVAVGINTRNRRRSRRFKIHLPMHFDFLRTGERFSGVIEDISAHGATIRCGKEDFVFEIGDQVRLHIPILKVISPEKGDFFNMSGLVKRVYISANSAALSFEHLTETQFSNLLRIVTGVIRNKVPDKKPRSF